MKLTILGNNSAIPAHGRHPTAQILEHNQKLFLIDCGEGTQVRLQKFNFKRNRIHSIFISHLHGDHYFGLIGLISSMNLLGREKPLYIYAPPALKEIIDLQIKVAESTLCYPIDFFPIPKNTTSLLVDEKDIKISCFPVEHRIPTHGFRFESSAGLRKINLFQCERHEIPVTSYKLLQEGHDFITPSGETVSNAILTFDGVPSKTYVYAADTRIHEGLATKIGKCDLLYHESTYLHADADKAYERFHATSKEAALIAEQAGAQKLLLGHFSSRYKDLSPFLEEAITVFPNTILSETGLTYKI